jgi:hypothetical protein
MFFMFDILIELYIEGIDELYTFPAYVIHEPVTRFNFLK